MFGLFKKKDHVAEKAEPSVIESLEDQEVSTIGPPDSDRELPTEPKVEAPENDVSDEFIPPSGMTPGMPSHIPGFNYSPVDPDEEFKATMGEPLPDDATIATEDAVVEALRTVYDPEIPVNIYDLGLIYGLTIGDNGRVDIDMTLTAPGCPVAGEMPGMVAEAVNAVEGTGEIEVLLVWEPQWTPENMSEDAKLALGMG